MAGMPLLLVTLFTIPKVGLADEIDRASVAHGGGDADLWSRSPSLSGNGRYVVFESAASNLVVGDTNDLQDIFVRDLRTGTTDRVSVATNGKQAVGPNSFPSITHDGRYVVFQSYSRGLVRGDLNGKTDIFIHDRLTRTTKLLSANANGRPGNGGSYSPWISASGRYVAFWSWADNLVADDSNQTWDIFVLDRQAGTMTRLDLTGNDHLHNLEKYKLAFSSDGRNLVPSDTNEAPDVFLLDREAGAAERVSVSGHGRQSNGNSVTLSLSAGARFVAFDSFASNLVARDTNSAWDVFVRDRKTAKTERVSLSSDGRQGNGDSRAPSISANGRFVTFFSHADNLVEGDVNDALDVFVHDRRTGKTVLVSAGKDGDQGNSGSYAPSINDDGSKVAFLSAANNLVADDANGMSDVFVRDFSWDASANPVCPRGKNWIRIHNLTYPPGKSGCAAGVSIRTEPKVTISANSIVAYDAPMIALQAGFRVKKGGVFRIGSQIRSANSPPADAELVRLGSSLPGNDGDGIATGADADTLPMARRIDPAALPQGLRDRLRAAAAQVSDLFIDADGEHVLFVTEAGLSDADDNGVADVYLYGVELDTLWRVSATSTGAAANGPSRRPRMDGMALRIAFESEASNLVTDDTNEAGDIFLADRTVRVIERVSWTPLGGEATESAMNPALDAAGEWIVYARADDEGHWQIYGYDTLTLATESLAVQEDDAGRRLDNQRPGISADGRYLVHLETARAQAGLPESCTVHFLDRDNGASSRLPCPDALRGEVEFLPFFGAEAEHVDWVEQVAPAGIDGLDDEAAPDIEQMDNPLALLQ
jgi:Tol biopolymer transport system component